MSKKSKAELIKEIVKSVDRWDYEHVIYSLKQYANDTLQYYDYDDIANEHNLWVEAGCIDNDSITSNAEQAASDLPKNVEQPSLDFTEKHACVCSIDVLMSSGCCCGGK